MPSVCAPVFVRRCECGCDDSHDFCLPHVKCGAAIIQGELHRGHERGHHMLGFSAAPDIVKVNPCLIRDLPVFIRGPAIHPQLLPKSLNICLLVNAGMKHISANIIPMIS